MFHVEHNKKGVYMDLLKYLEPMKNLPKRFSNLAFWRDVRKFKDEVVNAFEYVDSWGTHLESSLAEDASLHPYIKIPNESGSIFFTSLPVTLTPTKIKNTTDTYMVEASDTVSPSMPPIKLSELKLCGIALRCLLRASNNSTIISQYIFPAYTLIKKVNVDSSGYIKSFDIAHLAQIFTMPGSDNAEHFEVLLDFNIGYAPKP